MRRPVIVLALLVLGCGGRLTVPTVPPERVELDRLARRHAAGQALSPAELRRLAVLLDRYDNAPARADLIDAGLDDPRARQARAWRGWARLTLDWPERVAEAVAADPADPGSAALIALLPPGEVEPGTLASLRATREGARPITRCLLDALGAPEARAACDAHAGADLDAALKSLAEADPAADPEADRLRWTLAYFGPVQRHLDGAEAAARWLERWPRHAAAWAMAGASAAADVRVDPTEQVAWAGAAWHRAIALDPGGVRARLALADLEARHGLPAAAEAHRAAAWRTIGAERAGAEGWVRRDGLPVWHLPLGRYILQGGAQGPATAPDPQGARILLFVGEPGLPMRVTQRFTPRRMPWAPGCVQRARGAALFEQVCRIQAPPVDGTVWLDFPTDAAVERATIEVYGLDDARLTFESHGGAPGAVILPAGDGLTHARFELDGLDPDRRPRVRVRIGTPTAGDAPPPRAGMVDRLEALGEPRPLPGAPRRTVARLRAAGVDAVYAWIAVDGRPQPVWARPEGEGWAWFDADAAPLAGDPPLVAATRADWIGRRPSTIGRAPPPDGSSSDRTTPDTPPPGRP